MVAARSCFFMGFCFGNYFRGKKHFGIHPAFAGKYGTD
jgi:hypothetical protein